MIDPSANNIELSSAASRWPHRLAIALAVATFPLIWVGGLVTSYDAGMAVPDWPNTFGYNPLLYPIETWLQAPWGLKIEHAHRMLVLPVSLITLALFVVVWKSNLARSTKHLSQAALLLLLFQALLGGLRVNLNERFLAMVHACTGPLFFCLAIAIAFVTSRSWLNPAPVEIKGGKLQRLTLLIALLSYLQLLLGAQVRHISEFASSYHYQGWIMFHLFMAIILVGHILLFFVRSFQKSSVPRPLRLTARLLLFLILIQLGLGITTWVFKFGYPGWLSQKYHFAASFMLVSESLGSCLVATAHVATGSLILATSVVSCMMSFRFIKRTALVAAISTTPLVGAIA